MTRQASTEKDESSTGDKPTPGSAGSDDIIKLQAEKDELANKVKDVRVGVVKKYI